MTVVRCYWLLPPGLAVGDRTPSATTWAAAGPGQVLARRCKHHFGLGLPRGPQPGAKSPTTSGHPCGPGRRRGPQPAGAVRPDGVVAPRHGSRARATRTPRGVRSALLHGWPGELPCTFPQTVQGQPAQPLTHRSAPTARVKDTSISQPREWQGGFLNGGLHLKMFILLSVP